MSSLQTGFVMEFAFVRLSVRPSVTNTLTLAITNIGRALILGMFVLCDKTFPMVPCRDLDGYL